VKVFRVAADVNHYQYLLPSDSDAPGVYDFDCTPKEAWSPPDVYSEEPLLREGDIWGYGMIESAWAVRPGAIEVLKWLLSDAGELLALLYSNKRFALLNVMQCVNCLDQDKTEWEIGETTGKPIRIEKYAFHGSRLPESSIFKIPETRRGEILCYEGVKDPDDEFKPFVERHEITGLKFTELWSSD
jgi:hypothetical protein